MSGLRKPSNPSVHFFRFLIDRGADLSLVNNDGDLAIDIADSDEMESLLQREIDIRGKKIMVILDCLIYE